MHKRLGLRLQNVVVATEGQLNDLGEARAYFEHGAV